MPIKVHLPYETWYQCKNCKFSTTDPNAIADHEQILRRQTADLKVGDEVLLYGRELLNGLMVRTKIQEVWVISRLFYAPEPTTYHGAHLNAHVHDLCVVLYKWIPAKAGLKEKVTYQITWSELNMWRWGDEKVLSHYGLIEPPSVSSFDKLRIHSGQLKQQA